MNIATRSMGMVVLAWGWTAGIAEAEEWSRFRGPNGTGITDQAVPSQWDGPQSAAWNVALPGSGKSSPVVARGRVYLQTSSTDGRERRLVCLQLDSGRMVWQKDIPAHSAKSHNKNSLASGTPAADNQGVCAAVWDGDKLLLVAYDNAGASLWKHDLGEFKSQHGAAHSPILWKDKVIIANDQDGFSQLVAVRRSDGGLAWKTERDAHRSCYSTPLLRERPDGTQELVVVSTTGFAGYDPQTGREDWKWAWEGNRLRTVASPVLEGGLLFANAGDGAGDRHAIALDLGDLQKPTPHLAWEGRRQFPYVPSMLVWKDHLYTVNDRGVAGCYVAKTGETVWTERLGGDFSASPVLAHGLIYALSERGECAVFAAEPAFRLVGRSEVGESVLATPAIADSRLLIRGDQHLFCFGPK